MARKSRVILAAADQPLKTWNVAVYIRLSKEDAGRLDESESIGNQRRIIEEHISGLHDGDKYVIAGEYVDDGISGTTDDERRGFQQMLSDIKKGLINCVIVKDLARSFRNYSDQGYYLDDWFPRFNIRFISLFHQPLDSYKEPHNMRSIAVPIQGVLNENHCAETSDKVREVFDMKRRCGEHIGSFAVYGYRKCPENRSSLIVDEEAAGVVRDIFSMFLDGMSKNAIVRHLNDHGILCPSLYKRERLRLNYQNPNLDPAKKTLWCAVTITNILKNRMYCGDMVQGRCRIKSYKVHVQEAVPENEWYIVENTHEPIIDRDTFKKVQKLLSRDTRTPPQRKEPYLFSGFLRCADCGRAMSRSKAGGIVYYYCRTYKDQSKNACTKHTIKHSCLEAAVLCAVRRQICRSVDYEELLRQIDQSPRNDGRLRRLFLSIEREQRELARILRYKQLIYQDWKDGKITFSDYQNMNETYEKQAETQKNSLKKLQTEKEEAESSPDTENYLLKTFRQRQNIDRLTRDILIELVDHIRIQEGGAITIVFRFSDAGPLS